MRAWQGLLLLLALPSLGCGSSPAWHVPPYPVPLPPYFTGTSKRHSTRCTAKQRALGSASCRGQVGGLKSGGRVLASGNTLGWQQCAWWRRACAERKLPQLGGDGWVIGQPCRTQACREAIHAHARSASHHAHPPNPFPAAVAALSAGQKKAPYRPPRTVVAAATAAPAAATGPSLADDFEYEYSLPSASISRAERAEQRKAAAAAAASGGSGYGGGGGGRERGTRGGGGDHAYSPPLHVDDPDDEDFDPASLGIREAPLRSHDSGRRRGGCVAGLAGAYENAFALLLGGCPKHHEPVGCICTSLPPY